MFVGLGGGYRTKQPPFKALISRMKSGGIGYSGGYAPASVLASSRLHPFDSAPIEAANGLCRLLESSGVAFTGLSVGLPYSLETLPQLARVAAGHRLRVIGFDGPLPERLAPKPSRKRDPYLASPDDPEERLAAINQCEKSLDALAALGGSCLALELGRPPLQPLDEQTLRTGHERGELTDEWQPVARRFQKAKEDRFRLSPRWRDGARFALDRLVRKAEARGITLALRFGGSLWQFPSPREAAQLCADMTGSAVRIAFDSGAWSRLQALGLTAGEERRKALLANTALVFAHDACGLEGTLAAGLGTAPFDWLSDVPETAEVVLCGQTDTTADEIARAARIIETGLSLRTKDASASA